MTVCADAFSFLLQQVALRRLPRTAAVLSAVGGEADLLAGCLRGHAFSAASAAANVLKDVDGLGRHESKEEAVVELLLDAAELEHEAAVGLVPAHARRLGLASHVAHLKDGGVDCAGNKLAKGSTTSLNLNQLRLGHRFWDVHSQF